MRAIITGASAGIGLEMARYCYAQGMEVWITGQREEALKASSIELGNAPYLAVDLSTTSGSTALLEWIGEVSVDLFVNNAGYGVWKDVIEAADDELEKMIRLNVEALLRLSRVVAKRMVAAGSGRILNVASTAAFFAWSAHGGLLCFQGLCPVVQRILAHGTTSNRCNRHDALPRSYTQSVL